MAKVTFEVTQGSNRYWCRLIGRGTYRQDTRKVICRPVSIFFGRFWGSSPRSVDTLRKLSEIGAGGVWDPQNWTLYAISEYKSSIRAYHLPNFTKF